METGSCHGGMKAAILRIESNLKETDFFFLLKKLKKKRLLPSYKCGEFQAGRHSLLRSEMLTQYSAVIRPSAYEIVFIFQPSRGSRYSPLR